MNEDRRDTALNLGKDFAFGLQQTFACLTTDFIDPYVGKMVQDHFKDESHNVTLSQTWGGELIGDGAALAAFLGLQNFVPGVSVQLANITRKTLDLLLDKSGRRHLKRWAEKEQVAETSDAYNARLEDWKIFQADNIAKTSIISASSTVANVIAQKTIMRNTHAWPVVIASKLIGSTITMGAVLGSRFAMPKTTRQLDDELSEAYFSPLIRRAEKICGVLPEQEHAKRIYQRRQKVVRGEQAERAF